MIDSSQKFCPKCGAANPGASASATGAHLPASTQTTSSGSKTLWIVVAAVAGIVLLGVLAATVVTWQIARRTHVETNGEEVRVQTPFGTVETSKDAEAAARNLGVDVYPGAKALKDNAATVTLGKMKTTNAEFETSDPISKVADFYRQHYPNANVTVEEGDRYTILSTSKDSAITIHLEPRNGATHITIANVSGSPTGKHS